MHGGWLRPAGDTQRKTKTASNRSEVFWHNGKEKTKHHNDIQLRYQGTLTSLDRQNCSRCLERERAGPSDIQSFIPHGNKSYLLKAYDFQVHISLKY